MTLMDNVNTAGQEGFLSHWLPLYTEIRTRYSILAATVHTNKQTNKLNSIKTYGKGYKEVSLENIFIALQAARNTSM